MAGPTAKSAFQSCSHVFHVGQVGFAIATHEINIFLLGMLGANDRMSQGDFSLACASRRRMARLGRQRHVRSIACVCAVPRTRTASTLPFIAAPCSAVYLRFARAPVRRQHGDMHRPLPPCCGWDQQAAGRRSDVEDHMPLLVKREVFWQEFEMGRKEFSCKGCTVISYTIASYCENVRIIFHLNSCQNTSR